MANTTSAIDYLTAKHPPAGQLVNVLFGDEPYLIHSVLQAFKESNLSGEDADFGLVQLDCSTAAWCDVVDALATRPLFGTGGRLVILQDADDFVKQYRSNIEDYAKAPTTDGVLVLTVQTWQKNTRLYKQNDKTGLQIDCRKPSEKQLVTWLCKEAKRRFGFNLPAESAREMVEIIGCEIGVLEQELEKLALVTDTKTPLTPTQIRERVGGWRTKKAWDMLDAACDGDASEAIKQLQRLIHAGQHPIAILGQIAHSLRHFALATQIYRRAEKQGRRISLRAALEATGVQHYFLQKAERRLKRLGRHRAGDLYRWLLDADLAMKGRSSLLPRARLVLEQLLVRIAVPSDISVGPSPAMAILRRSG